MPKLHDACQIFAEDILHSLHGFSAEEAPFALALAYHAVEEYLLHNHRHALVIVEHFWLVLEETLQKMRPDLDRVGQNPTSPVGEGDLRIAFLSDYAVQTARELFPDGVV